LRKFFTGAPCRKGHIAEKYVSDGSCITCAKDRGNRRYSDKKPEILEHLRGSYQNNSEKIKARVSARREAEPDKVRAEKRKEYERNKNRYISRAAEWASANPEKARHSARQWHKNNPLKSYAAVVERRAKLRNRMPAWLSDEQKFDILAVYEKARIMSKETDAKYQVDHIIPLRGEQVSGLHVPWNLQILTAFENQSKGNRFTTG